MFGSTLFSTTSYFPAKPLDSVLINSSLNSDSLPRAKDSVKQLIASQTSGIDVSSFFPSVIRWLHVEDLELRKLAFYYVTTNAHRSPENAILVVNVLVKGATINSNPILRALSLRTMSQLRLDKVMEHLIYPLETCLKDTNSFVRKTAVVAASKYICFYLNKLKSEKIRTETSLDPNLHKISDNPKLVSDFSNSKISYEPNFTHKNLDSGQKESLLTNVLSLLTKLKEMLSDTNPAVLGNVLFSLNHIRSNYAPFLPLDFFRLPSGTLSRILEVLLSANEWSSLSILQFCLDSVLDFSSISFISASRKAATLTNRNQLEKENLFANELIEMVRKGSSSLLAELSVEEAFKKVAPRLSHSNPSVCMAACHLLVKVFVSRFYGVWLSELLGVTNMELVREKEEGCEKEKEAGRLAGNALVALLSSQEEMEYSVLCSVFALLAFLVNTVRTSSEVLGEFRKVSPSISNSNLVNGQEINLDTDCFITNTKSVTPDEKGKAREKEIPFPFAAELFSLLLSKVDSFFLKGHDPLYLRTLKVRLLSYFLEVQLLSSLLPSLAPFRAPKPIITKILTELTDSFPLFPSSIISEPSPMTSHFSSTPSQESAPAPKDDSSVSFLGVYDEIQQEESCLQQPVASFLAHSLDSFFTSLTNSNQLSPLSSPSSLTNYNQLSFTHSPNEILKALTKLQLVNPTTSFLPASTHLLFSAKLLATSFLLPPDLLANLFLFLHSSVSVLVASSELANESYFCPSLLLAVPLLLALVLQERTLSGSEALRLELSRRLGRKSVAESAASLGGVWAGNVEEGVRGLLDKVLALLGREGVSRSLREHSREVLLFSAVESLVRLSALSPGSSSGLKASGAVSSEAAVKEKGDEWDSLFSGVGADNKGAQVKEEKSTGASPWEDIKHSLLSLIHEQAMNREFAAVRQKATLYANLLAQPGPNTQTLETLQMSADEFFAGLKRTFFSTGKSLAFRFDSLEAADRLNALLPFPARHLFRKDRGDGQARGRRFEWTGAFEEEFVSSPSWVFSD